jgi:hypothetical protein
VRARQERVPFATVEDPDFLGSKVRPLVGRHVELRVSAESVALTEAAAAPGGAGGNGSGRGGNKAVVPLAAPLAARKVRTPVVVAMPDCEVGTTGAKAAACAQLDQVGPARAMPARECVTAAACRPRRTRAESGCHAAPVVASCATCCHVWKRPTRALRALLALAMALQLEPQPPPSAL